MDDHGAIIGSNFNSLSIEQLENILTAIKWRVSVGNSTKINTAIFINGMSQLEQILIYTTPLKVQGLSQISLDPDVLDTFKEVSLEYKDLFYTRPEYRLAYSILTAIGALHVKNTAMEAIKPKESVANIRIEGKLSNEILEITKKFDQDINEV